MTGKPKGERAVASPKPRSTARSSSSCRSSSGGPAAVDLHQVVELLREDGTTTRLVLCGQGKKVLALRATLLPATTPHELSIDVAVSLEPTCKGHLVSGNVIVNHQQHGCIGAFMKQHHEYAHRWFGDELVYQKVQHKNLRVLHHDWQHFVDKMGDQWGCDVRDLKPAYVKGGG